LPLLTKVVIIKEIAGTLKNHSSDVENAVKKLLVLILSALLIFPGIVFAQSATLSSQDISRIAESVVLVLALDGNGEPFASGSGTIVTPNGEIYTNRHVVEGGADYAILTLEAMGEPAQLAYFATATLVHPTVDFAKLQIDRDADGRRIDPNSLNLPVIPLASDDSGIGENIFVFGYPDLGEAHLVLTSGSVTTIINDTLNGLRLPFWYQTDAQISPGNSGGLAVNNDGQMIGIPTQVRAEERTLGRLGAILTVTAIRAALDDQQTAFTPDQTLQQATPAPTGKGTPIAPQATLEVLDQQLTIQISSVEHEVTQNEALGMLIHTTATAIGYLDVPLRAAVFLYWGDDTLLPANNRASSDARTTDGQLTLQQVVTPGFANTIWDDLWFFIPYDYLPDGRTGTFDAYISAQLGVDNSDFVAFSEPSGFTYTYPEQQLIINVTDIQHNVEIDGQVGMQVFAPISTLNYRGETLRVALFTYWDDGTPVNGTNAPRDFNTTAGELTVQTTLTPSFDDSQWNDFWVFLPYEYFPDMPAGEHFGYAQVEIGVDGVGFTSWSRPIDFSLTYS